MNNQAHINANHTGYGLREYPHEKEALKTRVTEIVKVSSVPSILHKITEIMEDENSTIRDLEKVIEHDQAIALRVLGISNSIYYGFSGRIGSIHQAILVLGFEMVKGVAISTAVFKSLAGENRRFVTGLWAHSFETAVGAALLAEKTGLAGREPAFLAGLLHDIGRPILYQIFGKTYFELASSPNGASLECEQRAFGAAHPEAGAWFAEKCKLPQDCIRAIRYHHGPEGADAVAAGPNRDLLPLVYIADLISLGSADASGRPVEISGVHAGMLKSLNIDEVKLNETKDAITGMKDEIRKYFE